MCTDLLTIGDGTVIRKDSFFSGYRVHAGVQATGTAGSHHAPGSDARVSR